MDTLWLNTAHRRGAYGPEYGLMWRDHPGGVILRLRSLQQVISRPVAVSSIFFRLRFTSTKVSPEPGDRPVGATRRPLVAGPQGWSRSRCDQVALCAAGIGTRSSIVSHKAGRRLLLVALWLRPVPHGPMRITGAAASSVAVQRGSLLDRLDPGGSMAANLSWGMQGVHLPLLGPQVSLTRPPKSAEAVPSTLSTLGDLRQLRSIFRRLDLSEDKQNAVRGEADIGEAFSFGGLRHTGGQWVLLGGSHLPHPPFVMSVNMVNNGRAVAQYGQVRNKKRCLSIQAATLQGPLATRTLV